MRQTTLVVALILLAAAPRLVMAWRTTAICPDSVVYIQAADALARGDLERGLEHTHLNVYPIVLMLGAKFQLNPHLLGQAWGVLVASLTVAPLFGWIRRQYDDSVALVAALIYIVHPVLIEWSPELLRDSTFWFLMATTLYLGWRAAEERRLGWYVATGVAWTLAVHTRFEGWFLLIPIVFWSVERTRWIEGGSYWRPAMRTLLAAAMCPVLLIAVNLTWLRDLDDWEVGHFKRFEYVVAWAETTLERASQLFVSTAGAAEWRSGASSWQVETPAPVAATVATPRMTLAETAWAFADVLRRGMTTAFVALIALGWLRWRRLLTRPEHLCCFVFACCVMLGIWIHLWYAQATSSRYPLSIVLVATPVAALSTLHIASLVERLIERKGRQLAYGTAVALVFAPMAIAGVSAAVKGADAGRAREAAVGEWILSEYGPGAPVVVNGRPSLVAYYSKANARHIVQTHTSDDVIRQLLEVEPSAAVVWKRHLPAQFHDSLVADAARLGYFPVADDQLPDPCRAQDVYLLVRKEQPSALAASEQRISR